MAVTTESAAEYLKDADPRGRDFNTPFGMPVAIFHKKFTFTQGAAAGDAGSSANLVRLPPGRVVFYPHGSRIAWSAFGASRVLDLGYGAYTSEADAVVNAALAAFDDDVDISAAGGAAFGSDLVAGAEPFFEFTSKGGVPIIGTVAGGTIPIAATLKGYVKLGIIGAF